MRLRRIDLDYEVLEPRILFAADGATDSRSTSDSASTSTVAGTTDAHVQDTSVPDTPPLVETSAAGGRSIVFVADDVADYGTLVAKLSPDHEVVVLDATRDGLAQMVETLGGRTDLQSIHVLTHGTPGAVSLGSLTLTAEVLEGRTADLSAIGKSLSSNGDILFYGCSVAQGEAGRLLVERLAVVTAADIAASDDRTGTTAGTDAVLERTIGTVEEKPLDLSATGWVGELAAMSSPSVKFSFVYQLFDNGSTSGFAANQTNPDIDPDSRDSSNNGKNIISSGGLSFTASSRSTNSTTGLFQGDSTQGNDVTGTITFTGSFKDVNGSTVSTGTYSLTGTISKHLKTADGDSSDSDGFYFWTDSSNTTAYRGLGFWFIVPGNESLSAFASTVTNLQMSADGGWISDLNTFYQAQQAYPSISVSSVTVSEASDYAVFTVSLSSAADSAVKFTPTLVSGGATVGTDTGTSANLQYFNGTSWVSASSGITMSIGATSVLVRTSIAHDSTYEGSETFTLSTSGVSGNVYNPDGASGTGTIVDDGSSTNVFLSTNNTATPTVGTADDDRTLRVSSVTVSENSDYAVFEVSSNSSTSVTLALGNTSSAADRDATLGTDAGNTIEYLLNGTWTTYTSGSVSITGGTPLLVRTTITPDNTYEGPETFTLVASNGTETSTGIGTIADDGSSTNVFGVNDTTSTAGTGTADNDKPTVSVNDVTVSEASPYAVFEISLSKASAYAISFTPTLTSGGATVGTDTGASSALEYYDGANWVSASSGITVAAGTTSVLVRTSVTNDSTYEGSETFTLSTGAITGTVTNSSGASGTGTIKDDGSSTNVFSATDTTSTPATGSANDDRPTISITDVSVNENSAYAVFKVSLSGTSASAITFTPSLASGGATLGDDFGSTLQYYNGTSWVSASSGVSIPAGSTSVLLRTTITDDGGYEGAETFTLSTGAVAGGVSNSTGVTGTGTIRDDGTGAIYPDDTTGNPDADAVKDDDRTVRVGDVVVNENSPYAVFTISGSIGQTVSLALVAGGATREDGSSPVATDGTEDFGPGLEYSLDGGTTWQTYSGSVTLTGTTLLVRTPVIDDTTYEGAESFRLSVTPSGGSAVYGTATIMDDGTGSIFPDNSTGNPDLDAALDDDRAVRVDDILVNEASPYAVFRVTSNSSTSLTLTLQSDSDLTTADAALGTDTAATSTLQYFNGTSWQTYSSAVAVTANQTLLVRIAITPDSTYEGAEKFQLVATPTAGTAGVGTATVLDDGTGSIYPDDKIGNPDPDAVKDDDRSVRVADILVNENSSYAVFTIKGTAGQNVTLGLQNDADSATANAALGTDTGTQLQYLLNGTWTNYTSGTVAIPTGGILLVRNAITDDATYEGAETYQLVVTPSGGNAVYGTATILDDGTGAIYPDDTVGNPDPSATKDDDRAVTVNDISVNENSSYAVFRVTSNATQNIALSLQNDADPLTANAALGTDTASNSLQYYDTTSSSWQTYTSAVQVTAGATLLVRVGILDDADFERAETFQLVATPASGLAAYGTATIYDDGTGDIYPDNSTGATDSSATKDDDRAVKVSDISVNENSSYAVFTITGTAGQNVSLALQNDADALTGDAVLGTDTGTQLQYLLNGVWTNYSSGNVAIPSGGTLLVRVTILDDTTYEDAEAFQLAVTPSGGNAVYGTATIYDDGTGDIYPDNTSGTTDGSASKDDDGAVAVADVTVNEGSDYVIFEVTGGVGRSMTLSLVETSGTGYADIAEGQTLKIWNPTLSRWDDYSGSATVPNTGKIYVRVSITAEHDSSYEGAETFKLRAVPSSGSTVEGTATIKDDGTGTKYTGAITSGSPVTDATGLDDDRTLTVSGSTISESSPYAVFSVTGTVGRSVTLSLTSGTGTVGTDTGTTLEYYDGSNWQTYSGSAAIPTGGILLVRVAVVNDAIAEGPETITLTASAGTASASGNTTIVDNGSSSNVFRANTNSATPATGSADDDRSTGRSTPTPPAAAPVVSRAPAPIAIPAVAQAPISAAVQAATDGRPSTVAPAVASAPLAPARLQLPSLGGLIADRPEFGSGGTFKVNVVDTQAAPGTTFSATLADGSPLPPGVVIDPTTGQISGALPPDLGQMDVRILATTPEGSRTLEIKIDFNERRTERPAFFALLRERLAQGSEAVAENADALARASIEQAFLAAPMAGAAGEAPATGAGGADHGLPRFSQRLSDALKQAARA